MAQPGTLYAHFFGGNGDVNYADIFKQNPVVEYPPNDQVTITGPLFLPQIYAADLAALELASSGKIALTLQDVHSLDIDRDVANNRIKFVTLCNDSLDILTATSNVTLSLDATSNNLVGTASNDILMTAGERFVVGAKTLLWNINGDIDFSASNDVHLYANSNVHIDAKAQGVYVTAAGSNVALKLDPATYSLQAYAASNVLTTASNDFLVTAQKNVGISAVDASLALAAAQSNATFVLDSADYAAKLYATSNVAVSASNDMHLTSLKTTTLSAAASNVSLALSDADYSLTAYSASNTSLAASNDFLVAAASNVAVTAATGSATVTADGGKVALTLDHATHDLALYALHDVKTTASNDFSVASVRDTSFAAGSNYSLTAAQNTAIVSTAGFVSASAAGATTTMLLDGAGAAFSAASNFGVAVSNDLALAANASNVYLTFTAQSNDLKAFAAGSVSQVASTGSFTASATVGDLVLKAAASNTLLKMNAADNTVTLWSSNDATVATSNNLHLTASNNATLSADGGLAQLQLLTANGGTFAASASNFSFTSGSNTTLFVDGSTVRVAGNLEVTGVIDSVSVQNTVLQVQDKLILVAHTSNDQPVTDGLQTNDQAGLRVEGLPASAKPADSNVYDYAKSVKWAYGSQGMDALGTSNADAESFWEMRGGSFRLTHTKLTRDSNGVVTDTKDLSFGFRVGMDDELELVKRYWSPSASNYVLKRVAKFGRTTTL